MICANNTIAFSFDAETGCYSVQSNAGNGAGIVNASFAVLGYNSRDAHSFSVSTAPFADAIGSGKQVEILGDMGECMTLMLQARLYDQESGLMLRCGLLNGSDQPLQVTGMTPMYTDGSSFSHVSVGPVAAEHHRMLTGEAGFSYARLINGVEGTSLNLMTILYANKPDYATAILGGLTTFEFQTEVTTQLSADITDGFAAVLRMFDATGKRVDEGGLFYGDWAYIDVAERNPYAALNSYAHCVAKAMDVKLNNYNDFISVCLWYVFAFSCGDRSANTSCGALQEAQAMIDSGITKYAPPLVRLVPDEYVNPNEQLWWDEPHWQKYNHLTAPYETLQKWMDAMRKLGAEGGLYMQPTFRSDDYCKEYPGHLLFNREENEADYSDSDFIAHMKQVYERVRDAGVKSMFYDYTMLVRGDIRRDENSLLRPGGFDDPYVTNVSAYRNIFKLAKDTCGRDFLITENTWNYSGQEVATGVIDAQRSKMDNVGMNPEVVKSGVRQWYRNKVTKLVDPDVKNFTVTDSDIRRKEVSLMGLLFGKTMLGSSITRYDSASIRDIGRILPLPMDGISATPLDLFLTDNKDNVSLFDYALSADDHIIALLNETHHQKTFHVSLSGEQVFGGLQLDAHAEYDLWDFWNETYIGRMKGCDTLHQVLRKNECRVIAVRKASDTLRVLSTNRHILQGVVETSTLKAASRELMVECKVIAGDPMRVVIALPQENMQVESIACLNENVRCRCEKDEFDRIASIYLDSDVNASTVVRLVTAVASAPAARPVEAVSGLRTSVDRVNAAVCVTWDMTPDVRYHLYKNGEHICTTTGGTYTDHSAEEHTAITYAVVAENTAHQMSETVSATVNTGNYDLSLLYNLGGDTAARFGAEGCILFNHGVKGKDIVVQPDYVKDVTVVNRKDYVAEEKCRDSRWITAPGAERAELGMVFDEKELTIKIAFHDASLHRVTLYAVDFNRSGRTMDFEVLDSKENILIQSRNIPEYGEGVYMSFACAGDVCIRMKNHAVNSVVSAIYFDKEDV